MTDLIRQIDAMLIKVPSWLTTVRCSDAPYGRYRYYPSSPRSWCMYATVSGLRIETRLGTPDHWSAGQRNEALSVLADCQSEKDGYFYCPVCVDDDSDDRYRCQPANRAGMSKKAIAALADLSAKPKHIPPLDENAVVGPVEQWLEQTFQQNSPYAAGSIVGHVIGVRNQGLLARGLDCREDHIVKSVLRWLTEHQDRETGLFEARDDLVNGINGLLKMRYGVFVLTGTAIPNADRVAETVLSLQGADGRFGRACTDFNAVHLLSAVGGELADQRAAIVRAFQRVLPGFQAKQRDDGGFCFEPDDTEEPNMIPTDVNVQGLSDIKKFLRETQ